MWVKCIHLTDDCKCSIYFSPNRPLVCDGFQADQLVCGNSREEAIMIFSGLEGLTKPELKVL
jgi:Fe-S-cluster containining protein